MSDGRFMLSKVDPTLKLVLTAFRACAVCGYPIHREDIAWRIYDELTRAQTHLEIAEGEVIDNDVPGHLVCMLYSALVCPYWRSAGGKLGKDTMFTPGSARGDTPAIMGFKDYGLLIDPTRPLLGKAVQPYGVLLEEYVGEILFESPMNDLASEYERLRKEVGGRYIASKRRHYSPDFGGQRRLVREAVACCARVQQGAERSLYANGHRVGLIHAGWM